MSRAVRASTRLLAAALFSIVLASCGSGAGDRSTIPPPAPTVGYGVEDRSTQPCTVSYDGLIWYAVPAGSFSPIDVRFEHCSAVLNADPSPPIPAWAKPTGPTGAVFVATSFLEANNAYSVPGLQSIDAVATAAHVPVTWMIADMSWLQSAALLNQYHASNGDDVEVYPNPQMVQAVETAMPWYVPHVGPLPAGSERNIAGLFAVGEDGFWGIAWDSAYVDGTNDVGAPWGTYCADVTSYKRPSPDGSCALLAFEWTARDLTRTYLSGHPEYFSTDPDDLQQRAGFDVAGAQAYEREIVDAYAAAGQSQPLVVVSQQEPNENAANAGDPQILSALYARAVADGLHVETLAQADVDARAFSAQPRAVAFPYLAGGAAVPSPIIGGQTLYPATIDYHDNVSAMTFLAGHTTPTRLFRYADDAQSVYNAGFPTVPPNQLPSLKNVVASAGSIAFTFDAPVALHYGVALWADPASLGITGTGVVAAGRAGVVLTFDLQPGANQIVFPCSGCTSTTFRYAT